MTKQKTYLALMFLLLLSSCDKIAQLYLGVETQPQSVRLELPKEYGGGFKVNDKTYTILLFGEGKSYIYQGNDINNQVVESCSMGRCSNIIIHDAKNKFGDEFSIIIKPSIKSSYKDVVDVLDEVSINGIKNYLLVDISDKEEGMINKAK